MSEHKVSPNLNHLLDSPNDMLIEVTNRCNHSCLFCAHRKMTQKQGEIDTHFLQRILYEAYDMHLRRVGLYTTGEMFMCKDIATHIRNAKEIGYEYIYADTNGALASEVNLTKVITAGVDSIKFSINAGTRESYAFIHGHDDFDRVIGNLKMCYCLKEKINPELKIMVSFIVTSRTEGEVELLGQMVAPYIDDFVSYPARTYFRQTDVDLSNLELDVNSNLNVKIPCPPVFNRIHVTYDGFLSACCLDFNHDLLLADLNKMSLKDAWECDDAVNFRAKHLNNQLENTICFGCSKGKYIPYKALELSAKVST